MKKNILLSLMLILNVIAQAQEKGSYLLFNIGGGKHNINYDLAGGTVKSGLGLTGNIAYNYFFTPNWGVGTGIGFQSYHSTAILDYMSTNPSTDTDGDTYDYRIYYASWKEKQKLLMLDIPIAVNYQTALGAKSGLLFSFGAKISIPAKSTFKTAGGEINTTGYYPQWNVELSDMPQHNFKTITDAPGSYFTAKTLYSGFADLGYLYKLTQRMDLYIGGYVNYGLNNLINPADKFVYQEDGTYNGVMASNQTKEAKLLSFGLKIGINLHLSKKKEPVEVVQIENPDLVKKDSVIVKADTAKKQEVVVIPVVTETKDSVVNVVKDEKKENFVMAEKIATEIKLNFEVASDVIINQQEDKYDEIATMLKNNPTMKLLIVGHTSLEGTKEVNIKIGWGRADRVKDIFLKKGVSETQLMTDNKYYLEPIAPNTTEESRAKNRRVELHFK